MYNGEAMTRRIARLEQVAAIQILILLLEGPLKMTEIISRLEGSNRTPYTAIPRLKELGLVSDEVTPYPVKRIFTLTEKGRQVAGKLAEIENILSQPSVEAKGKVTDRSSGMPRVEKFKEEITALEKKQLGKSSN
jgi:DNA-binding PadR family transcriptional regulator